MLRRYFISFITIALGFAAPIVVLEIFFRFLPVMDITNDQPVNDQQPYIRYKPNKIITFSKGWDFSLVTHKHVNNYGYMSDIDYVRGEPAPLATIIGDSYVEAMQLPNSQTMHGLLAERVKAIGKVYGIGYSGSPLSQYLAFSKFAHDEFSPEAMVFIVVGNDFDESLMKYKWDPGFHYFEMHNQTLRLVRIDFAGHTGLRNIAKHMALARYLFLTAGLDWRKIAALWNSKEVGNVKYVGNVPAVVPEERLRDSRAAVERFIELLPKMSGLSTDKILFVVDAKRPNLYTEEGRKEAKGSYFDLMRTYFIKKTRQAGYEVVDMQPVFEKHYSQHRRRFEYPIDAHWNALGHELVADEIEKSRVFQKVFSRVGK